MRLGSYLDSSERQATHDRLIVFMRGANYNNQASFETLQAASKEIECMARSIMPSMFHRVEVPKEKHELHLYFVKGTACSSQRLALDELRGWIALFLHHPNE